MLYLGVGSVFWEGGLLFGRVWALFISLNLLSAHMVFARQLRTGRGGTATLAEEGASSKCQQPGYFQ